MNLVFGEVGETDFKYWDGMLAEFNDEDLERGLEEAEDFTGRYFLIGHFKDMCRVKPIPAIHREFLPEPECNTNPEQRKEFMKKLRAETGI